MRPESGAPGLTIGYQDESVIAYLADVRVALGAMADESVQCVVTSPPYFGLRDYGVAGQLGLEAGPVDYLRSMMGVFKELRRVLRTDGTLWLNMGDCYATKPRGTDAGWEHSRLRNPGRVQKAQRAAMRKDRTFDGLKHKDMVGTPWRLAFAAQGFAVVPGDELEHAADLLAEARAVGDWELVEAVEGMLRGWAALSAVTGKWWVRSDIIWVKPNAMPESIPDRPTKAHEFVFLLTKSGRPRYWSHPTKKGVRSRPRPDFRWRDLGAGTEGAREPAGDWRDEKLGDGRRRWLRVNLWEGHDYYYDAIAVREPTTGQSHDRGNGVNPKAHKYPRGWDDGPGSHSRRAGRYRPKQNASFAAAVRGRVLRRNRRTVWTIPTQGYPGAHFATFPERLVEPCIEAGTSERGCCAVCGAPWVRQLERTSIAPLDYQGKHGGAAVMSAGRRLLANVRARREAGGDWDNPFPEPLTRGWARSCAHDATVPVPCTVLDPFAGSGTVLAVAKKLGRFAVGIELNPEYMSLLAERCSRAASQTRLDLAV